MTENEGALPIFDVQKVELQFDISADFVAAQVADNVLILALSSGRILRFDLDNAADIDDIDLPKRPAEIGIIRRMFLDPTASHLIISTTLGENYYLHTQSRQPKSLSRLKGQIDCVAWNPSRPTASTREILVGLNDGNVCETYIESSTEFYRREEKYVKSVYRSPEGAITGIWTDNAPGRQDIRRVVLATKSSLLQFISRSSRSNSDGTSYQKLFENEAPLIRTGQSNHHDRGADFRVGPDSESKVDMQEEERAFAWLAGQEIMTGALGDPSQVDAAKTAMTDAKIIPIAKISQLPRDKTQARGSGYVQSIMATRFHILAIIDDRLVAINPLDESIVHDRRVLQPTQRFLGLFMDQQKSTFWLLTQREIYEIVVTDEARNMWRIMLAEQNFDRAVKFASNSEQRDSVAIASGDHLIGQGKYLEAASIYGKSSKPFEDVTLSLIDQGQHDALRKYLTVKLDHIKKSREMQRMMLASWLVELYMVKLNFLDDAISATAESATGALSNSNTTELQAVRLEFQDFVTRHKPDLDQKTMYEVIGSHGREDELLYFASAIDDNDYVLSYWVQRERWQDAMAVLKRQTKPDVFYQYSSVLMQHLPVDFVEVLMRQTELDSDRLIPALLNYNHTAQVPLSQNQAIRYLLFCINQQASDNASIHNTLISMYASHSTTDESGLLKYLQSQENAHRQIFDADFALRLCISHARVRSAVHIYCTMSQYGPAIDLALKHDEIDLAADVADRPDNDQVLRKKLWLKVAKKVMSRNQGIAAAMEFLKRCDFLRIEDLIPLFPDFIVIDDFKQEICDALEEYSRQIDNLRLEMDKSAETAQNIKHDIKALDQRYAIVEPHERCWICRLPLLMRQFFVFPCQHSFHADCLGKAVIAMGPAGKGRRIKEIQSEIGRGMLTGKKRERFVKELDGLVASACVLCGETAVKQIDQPFVTAADDVNEWAV